ncbi:polymorphic toxin type 47 domain-containing protein [Trichocoleus sp. DQ-U1]|uniref:polymorphic toxin type 47 domain-containing protein n=1 Tax=Trichocoleus sp. DQ-U1 TaxID=2933926 RepID=UPI0032984B53
MFNLFRSKRTSFHSGKRFITTSITTTVWIVINFCGLPIQAQSDYEGLGRRGTRIWGERACDISGLNSQEEITEFLEHCAPKYTPEEQAYVDMQTEAAIGALVMFFFDLGIFRKPSPSVVRRVTNYIDEGVSTTGTYRGNTGTRTIVVQRRNGKIAIRDINTGETRIVNSRTGQLVDDVDDTIANRRQNNRSNTTTEEPCLSYAPTYTSKTLITKLYSQLSIKSAQVPCRNGNSRQATQERDPLDGQRKSKYQLTPDDLDWRGQAKTTSEAYQLYNKALKEAFKRTGVDEKEFRVTKWAEDGNGTTWRVEWKAGEGAAEAEVSVDYYPPPPYDAIDADGPNVSHVGWKAPGKIKRGAKHGHILLDFVPAGRPPINRSSF